MPIEEKKSTFDGQKKSGKNGTWRRRQGFEITKREAGGVPILRFGKGNNFHQFKQALSEVSLRELESLVSSYRKEVILSPNMKPQPYQRILRVQCRMH